MLFSHEEDDLVWDHFPATPSLSTFAVNILVTDFDSSDPMEISTSMGKSKSTIFKL